MTICCLGEIQQKRQIQMSIPLSTSFLPVHVSLSIWLSRQTQFAMTRKTKQKWTLSFKLEVLGEEMGLL